MKITADYFLHSSNLHPSIYPPVKLYSPPPALPFVALSPSSIQLESLFKHTHTLLSFTVIQIIASTMSLFTTLTVLLLALVSCSEARRSPRPLSSRSGGVDLSSYTVPLSNGKPLQDRWVQMSSPFPNFGKSFIARNNFISKSSVRYKCLTH